MIEVGPRRVEIIATSGEYDGFFRMEKAVLRHERYDGSMSDVVSRLVCERSDSVAVLPYDEAVDAVLLVQQFRYPAYVRGGPGWIWEVVAGVQEDGRDPESVACSELLEEAGLRLDRRRLHLITTFYPSPGGSTERVHLYWGHFSAGDWVARGGGSAAGRDDIRVVVVPFDEAWSMLEAGEIVDGKKVIALQYLALRKAGMETSELGREYACTS